MVGAIAGILIDWGVSKAADVLFDQAGNQIKTRLNKDDLQQAIAMQITIDIPDDIASRLEPLKDQLPQILTLGLQEFTANPSSGFSGLTEILEFFAKLPTAEEILDLRLSPTVQTEIETLLEKNRTEGFNERDRPTPTSQTIQDKADTQIAPSLSCCCQA